MNVFLFNTGQINVKLITFVCGVEVGGGCKNRVLLSFGLKAARKLPELLLRPGNCICASWDTFNGNCGCKLGMKLSIKQKISSL